MSGTHGPACDGQAYPHDTTTPCPTPAGIDAATYRTTLALALAVIAGSNGQPLHTMCNRIAELAEQRRYETAARQRDAATTLIETLARQHRLHALARLDELVAARPDGQGGWQIAVIRHGQLAGAAVAQRSVPPMPIVDAATRSAQVILPTKAPFGGSAPEEIALIARWLTEPGVRIVRSTSGYTEAAGCSGQLRQWAATARSARIATNIRENDWRGAGLLAPEHPTRRLASRSERIPVQATG